MTRRRPRALLSAAIAGAALTALLGACAEEPEIRIELCGDMRVPVDIDAIRVFATDDEFVERFAGVIALLRCPSGETSELPLSYAIGGQTGDRWVGAQGIRDGVEVARVETRIRVADGGVTEVTLQLARACLGQFCPLGQTCVEGKCVVTPFQIEAPMDCSPPPPPADLPDGGATPPDAGAVVDAGPDADPAATVHPYCREDDGP